MKGSVPSRLERPCEERVLQVLLLRVSAKRGTEAEGHMATYVVGSCLICEKRFSVFACWVLKRLP